MEPGELKPVLTALILPPASPVLLAAVGVGLGLRRRIAGAAIAAGGMLLLWLLSCNAIAVALANVLLPQFGPIDARELRDVQAIVVLGGGVDNEAPEYGQPQPAKATLVRLRYAAHLARIAGKPIAISGGAGWGGVGGASEAEVDRQALADDYGVRVRWIDARSRDTRENARLSADVLQRDGIRRIALVTDATHMARSVRNFREAGFEVVAAPTAFIRLAPRAILDWLPSIHGLENTTYVLHEWLGLRLT